MLPIVTYLPALYLAHLIFFTSTCINLLSYLILFHTLDNSVTIHLRHAHHFLCAGMFGEHNILY